MVDVARVSEFLREVADAEILPRFRTLEKDEKWHKEIGGLVTVADIESEKFLSRVLVELLPGSLVLGEESAASQEQPYRCLEQDAPVWIIDPLDGTNNFAKGSEDFAVIVALSISKRIWAGWIYAPIHGLLIHAEEGAGTWLGEERLNISDGPNESEMRGSLGRRFREYTGMRERFADLSNASCCGMEYLDMARGKLDFAHFRRLKPWDHAAGDIIVREAGGFVACLNGTRYQPGDTPTKGLLSARGQNSWNVVAKAIDPVFATLPN